MELKKDSLLILLIKIYQVQQRIKLQNIIQFNIVCKKNQINHLIYRKDKHYKKIKLNFQVQRLIDMNNL